MLSLNGNNGDQLVVTFVNAFACVIGEQTINGGSVYLHRDSIDVRPGDRCRVTLIDAPANHGPCLVRVDEVLSPGDGSTSLLEKTLYDIGISGWGCNSCQEVLANLRDRCQGPDGDQLMLETLLDVLETFSKPNPRRLADLEYGHYCIVISRLVNKLYADNVQTRIALYERAAQYCSAQEAGRQWGESFTAVADSLRRRSASGAAA